MLLAAHAGTFDWMDFLQPKLLHHGPENEVHDKKHGRIKGPVQYVLHSRSGLGQASVSLGAPRMQQTCFIMTSKIEPSHKGISTVSPRMPDLILNWACHDCKKIIKSKLVLLVS